MQFYKVPVYGPCLQRNFDDWKTFVSSAYIVDFPLFRQNGKSSIKIRNKSGPRQEPWGTPQLISFNFAKLFSPLQVGSKPVEVFFRSINSRPVYLPLSIFKYQSFVEAIRQVAISVTYELKQ